jgi:hypothetical protein
VPDLSRALEVAAIDNLRVPGHLFSCVPVGEATHTERLKSGADDLKELARSWAHRDFRPTDLLRLFLVCLNLCAFASLREFFFSGKILQFERIYLAKPVFF